MGGTTKPGHVLWSLFSLLCALILLAGYVLWKELGWFWLALLVVAGLSAWSVWVFRRVIQVVQMSVGLAHLETSVMLASKNRIVRYINGALSRLFSEREQELQAHFPHFSVQSLVGTCVDVFHVKKPHLAHTLSNIKQPMKGTMHIGSLNFEIVAKPIQLGWWGNSIAVEWHDRTQELKMLAQTEENQRIRQALDCAETKLMVVNKTGAVVYWNTAMRQLFKELQVRYGVHLDEKKIANSSIDSVYAIFRNKHVLQKNSQDAHFHLEAEGVTVEVIEKVILGDNQEAIGKTVEWNNISEALAHNLAIDEAISRILKGDVSQPIPVTTQTGMTRKITEGLNALMKVREGVINEASRVLSAMAQGDLTLRIENEYEGIFEELKRNVNASCEKLSDSFSQLRDRAENVALGSEEISRGNHDLNNRTQQQASTLEETASSMEEMSNTVRENASQSKKAFELSQSARNFAQQGGDVTNNMVIAMGAINHSSTKIQNIIGVIDDIAFQTNLLALNAAVEAARAGEQGRGFAVVASEVRSLAQRSAASAKEIQSLISDSAQKVKEGERLVNESQISLQHIVNATQEVNQLLTGLSQSAEQQAQAIVQINTAVAQLDSMTQQNASLVEEVSAASESMSGQVQEMGSMISWFKFGQGIAQKTHRSTQTMGYKSAQSVVRAAVPVSPPKRGGAGQALPEKSSGKTVYAKPSEEGWEEF